MNHEMKRTPKMILFRTNNEFTSTYLLVVLSLAVRHRAWHYRGATNCERITEKLNIGTMCSLSNRPTHKSTLKLKISNFSHL